MKIKANLLVILFIDQVTLGLMVLTPLSDLLMGLMVYHRNNTKHSVLGLIIGTLTVWLYEKNNSVCVCVDL